MWAHLDRHEIDAGGQRHTAEDSRLAAGTGAQVEPAGRQRGVGVDRGERQRQELGALVLDRGAPVPHRRDLARVTGAEHRADR